MIADDRDAFSRLPRPGEQLGQYEIIRELGRGGMGAVFAARDTKLGRKVAIKFLFSADQPELTARFILEARATARCSHENIVVIHEVGERRGHPFMVLEHLRGATLTRRLEGGRALPPARAVELMVPVVRALVLAHEHNIVHRDLKPDNIFLTDAGTVKVLDFGIAKLLHGGDEIPPALLGPMESAAGRAPHPHAEASAALTRQGALVGTLPYMSPEQWGTGIVDHQTDIWAVGVILFRMITGKHPLHPRRGRELFVTGLLDEPMPRVHSTAPAVPDELAEIIDRCLVKPKERRIESARELLAALEPLLPGRRARPLRADQNPYAGLNAFQESDAHRFFGRTREVATAIARLRDQPLLGVLGPSGVGKSSFVRAGLVPALDASGERWRKLVIRPGRDPMRALASVIAPMVDSTATTVSGDLAEQDAVLERLHAEPGYFGAVLRGRARRRDQRVLLFVDQFEELYTQVPDPRRRLAFTACLASVCDDATTPLRLVLSLRSDFLEFVPEDPSFMAELTHGLFFLTPPDRDGLRDALIRPAEMAGFQFETAEMVEHVLDHLEHTPGGLPLLQFAASRLWELRDADRRLLTRASYQRIGGIEGALASHAEAVWSAFPNRGQALVRALFLRLITPERTRAVVTIGDLFELGYGADPVRRSIDQLVAARLLVIQTGVSDAGVSVEIVHESLIHSWPRLRRWLDENQDDAVFLEQLRNAAKQWRARSFAPDLLWSGETMEEARLWHRRYRGALPDLERSYLSAVFALAERSSRRKRLAVAGVIGLLSALVAAAAVALVLITDAQREAKAQAAEATRLLGVAKSAEATANDERAKAVAAKSELERNNADLLEAVAAAERARREAERLQGEAEEARLRAERSKRRERRSKEREEQRAREAQEARRLAEAATVEAERRRGELAVLLDRESRRVAELEAAMERKVKIFDDVSEADRKALEARRDVGDGPSVREVER